MPQKPFLVEEADAQKYPWVTFFEPFELRVFLPIILRNDVLGLAAFGKKLVGGTYRESEVEFLSSLANIAATSIQNGRVFEELKAVNMRLDKKVQELHTLFDIGKELNATLDAQKALKLLSYGLMGELMLNRFAIYLRRDQSILPAERRGFEKLALTAEHLGWLFAMTRSSLVEDIADAQLRDVLDDQSVVAVVPMRSQEQTKGVLLLGQKLSEKPFTNEEMDFLFTLGNQAMISLENAWLFEDSLERKRLEEELALARQIQAGLLPTRFPELDTFEVYGLNVPSQQVGGDYFDALKISDRRTVVAVADVSGKGIPASLLMSNVQASLKALSSEDKPFHEIVSRINDIIYSNTDADKFITFFGGVLDASAGTFTYVNAGHNPPYWVHPDGSFQLLEMGGLLLGMMPGVPYEYETIHLQPGDRIVMFTDGVTEAMDPSGAQYEEPRLEIVLKRSLAMSAKETTHAIADDVKRFCGTAPQSDDITVVVIKARSTP
jgi:sigma-B regulation protein RsbU (phosphoserine phosphatase)